QVEPQMPKDEDPLTAGEIAVLRQWIEQGARATPSSAAAPPPWEPPLALTKPAVPGTTWPGWDGPLDRLVSRYLARRITVPRTLVSDATFARRAYLDIWGLLPTPEESDAFAADRSPDKRARLAATLLAD